MATLARPADPADRRPAAPRLAGAAAAALRILDVRGAQPAAAPLRPHAARLQARIGLLSAAYSGGLIPGALLGGWLASRFGVRRTTLAGLLGFSVTTAAFGLVGPLWALDALRAAQGVFCGLIWVARSPG